MAMYLYSIFLMSSMIILLDWWFFRKMKKHNYASWIKYLSLVPAFVFIASFFYIRYWLRDSHDFLLTSKMAWIFVALSMIYVPKVSYVIFYTLNVYYNRLFNKKTRLLSTIGFGIGVVFIGVFSYSIIVTRSHFYPKTQVIEVKDLPPAFDGYRIALFADFHLGNWNQRYKIMEPIAKIVNEMDADIIIFAGDMINNFKEETLGWEPYFKMLKPQDKMYAVLGNHDYGDYTNWKSPAEKSRNLEGTKQNIRKLGFYLLLNENTDLIKANDTISLIGVENFGSGHFDSYSDLNKALKGTSTKRKKILITHDPNHWNAEVTDKHPDIFLSVSGHTHAGQLGITEGKIRISPASLMYPQWDGLYQKNDQYLYVNRGIGFVGVPTRVGVPPEITLIILKRKKAE